MRNPSILLINLIGLLAFTLGAGAPTTAPSAATTTTTRIAFQRADVPARKVSATTRIVEKFNLMHEKFLQQAKAGNVDLLFLGDSITEGWGGNGKDVWKETYGKLNPANFGIGGDKTQHVLWRITNGELEGIKPKLVVLMIGTNNIGSNPPEQIAKGVENIVNTLRDKADSKVLLLAVFPRGENAEKAAVPRAAVATVNAAIAELDDGKDVRYLDLSKQFMESDGSIKKEIMPDFLHLSPKGYRLWADGMEPLLAEMMQ